MNKWLLLLAVAASLFASCSHSDKPATEPAAEESKKPKTIEISEEARKKSGITIEAAGPAVLKRTLKLNGKIGANEDRMAHVSPRFPGIVKSIAKRLKEEDEELLVELERRYARWLALGG